MTQSIKAIETHYKGYRFRSRLEARYAVFFDSMPIPETWEYEKEGFDLNGVFYLPDFYLPRFNCYIEIKGKKPSNEELEKAKRFRDITGQAIAVFHGLPSEYWGVLYCFDLSEDSGGSSDWEVLLGNDGYDGSLVFGVRHLKMRKHTLYSDDECTNEISQVCESDWIPCVATDIALDAAKAARFEHGESPENRRAR